MKKVTIAYRTINVPAPFAHQYTLDLEISTEISAKYEIRYIDRDSLSEEEILEEGYSTDDDFSWQGKIDPVWLNSIKELINKNSEIEKKDLTEFTQTEVTVTVESDGEVKAETYYDSETLEYKIQEIIQALFETSGRETPLTVDLLHKSGKGSMKYEVLVSFAKRTASINANGSLSKKLTWDEAASFMSLIYQPDYLLETTKTKKNGLYISFENDFWFSVDDIEESERLSGFGTELMKFLNK